MRLAHWLLAFSVMLLIATGWLMEWAPSIADTSSNWHRLAGIGLTLGLFLRLWLLFFASGPAHWKALVPVRADVRKMGMMLRFYLTRGKSPLPKWYAHSPLWAPVYLVILAILGVQTVTGLLMEAYPVAWMFYLPSVHEFWAVVVLVFSCLHIIAVIWHDAKGTSSDVSAMLNGYRIFIVEEPEAGNGQTIQSIRLDRINKPH